MLSKYKQLAIDAFRGISFSPEKRAAQIILEYSRELEHDIEKLEDDGEDSGNYRIKYEAYLCKWLGAMSACLSPMIVGPAKFPYARNEKNFNREMNAYDKFRSWRDRYFKSTYRKRTLSPEGEIDRALLELDRAVALQEMMKDINKIIRSKKKTEEEKKKEIAETYDLTPDMIDEIFSPDCFGGIGFASFTLTNNNAKIKRLKDKLQTMRLRIERKEVWDPIGFDGGTIDIENDRVVIYNDTKPDYDIISALKGKGFRWSPKHKCWCRKHTARAVYDAKTIFGIK